MLELKALVLGWDNKMAKEDFRFTVSINKNDVISLRDKLGRIIFNLPNHIANIDTLIEDYLDTQLSYINDALKEIN